MAARTMGDVIGCMDNTSDMNDCLLFVIKKSLICLFLARTPAKARAMERAVNGRLVEKEYLARVVGEFPRLIEYLSLCIFLRWHVDLIYDL